jgi:hypothetical protein
MNERQSRTLAGNGFAGSTELFAASACATPHPGRENALVAPAGLCVPFSLPRARCTPRSGLGCVLRKAGDSLLPERRPMEGTAADPLRRLARSWGQRGPIP